MRYTNSGKDIPLELQDKAALRAKIGDVDWIFTRAELKAIIHNEFFNDDNALDGGLVDAAVARLLLLDGIDLNAQTLQHERERMIAGVIREIMGREK